MFYPHTIKGKPFPREDLISEPEVPNIPGPNFTVSTFLTQTGSTAPNQFKLPLISSLGYLAKVEWGDGNETIVTDGLDVTHDYYNPGTYNITITGIFPSMAFYGFGDCVKIINFTKWGAMSLTSGTFDGCVNATFNSTDTFSVLGTSLSRAFKNCSNLNNCNNLDILAVDDVTDMEEMFDGCGLFNQDITGWNTGNVQTFKYMFRDNTSFNQNVNSWNMISATSTFGMFWGASSFNQNLNSLNMSNVIQAQFMFANATVFNGNITSWNTSNMNDIAGMFLNAPAFNQDISGWDVSNVISCGGLFSGASSFNQNINSWDTSTFGTLEFIFQNAVSFNQDLSNWDTSNVLEMQGAFNGATAFNQDISNFNVGNVTTMENMLDNCGMNTTNYDAYLNSCAAQAPTIQNNVTLGAQGMEYSVSALASRSTLVSIPYSWDIQNDTAV